MERAIAVVEASDSAKDLVHEAGELAAGVDAELILVHVTTDEEYADRRAREAIEGAEVVVVADGDADGLGCVALLRERYDAALDVAPFEASLAARTDPSLGDDEEDEDDD